MANDADIFAGKQLRKVRHVKHVSQETLAEVMGITFQQVQKYEKGSNRISVSRLHDICCYFKIEPNFFFRIK